MYQQTCRPWPKRQVPFVRTDLPGPIAFLRTTAVQDGNRNEADLQRVHSEYLSSLDDQPSLGIRYEMQEAHDHDFESLNWKKAKEAVCNIQNGEFVGFKYS